MPVSQRKTFEILSAVDVAQEPSSHHNTSGRVLDVEVNEEDDSNGWRANVPGKRCLKLALKDVTNDQISIGIELSRINWENAADLLIGKQVNAQPANYL